MTYRSLTTLALLGAFAAAGCAQTFEADVARFHELPAGEAQTVKVVPADPDKTGSLEFRQYANLIRAELAENGYRAVDEDPDLIATLGWRLSEPRERIRSRGGGYGFGHGLGHGFGHGFGHHGLGLHGFGHHGFGHFGIPHYGFGRYGFGHGIGHGLGSVRSETVRDLTLRLEMQRPAGETVFEGRAATTLSGEADLPAVMPHMAQALFTNFPGESGRTQNVKFKLAQDRRASRN